jgi:hypothetical protein
VPVHIPAAGTSVPPVEDKDKTQENKDREAPGTRPDDGELGGVALGMQTWDDYERELKAWEAAEVLPVSGGGRR